MHEREPYLAVAAIALVAAALFGLERLFPLRARRRPGAQRLLVNLFFSAGTYGTAGALVGPAGALMLDWTERQQFGLVRWLPELPWLQWGASLLLPDLSFYYWHRANHRLPVLWRFHNVHHFDPDLDVTTGFRFHPGEVALSALFRFVQIGIIGPPLAAFVLYEVVFQTGTFFHHSNFRLPARLDRTLALFVVTPRMHGIHHSQRQHESNSNYSVVFSFWDRLHRSLRLEVLQERITIGVPAYDAPDMNRALRALVAPFRRQRSYWS